MNNLLNVAVCEDNPKDMGILVSLIIEGSRVILCDRFYSGESFLKEFISGKYDIVFWIFI